MRIVEISAVDGVYTVYPDKLIWVERSVKGSDGLHMTFETDSEARAAYAKLTRDLEQ